ncbi:MAG: NUDIX hydrolase [Armatimonadetes bacterium]|nr:NUDIX hydrolase [Armatimonadota bacterium]
MLARRIRPIQGPLARSRGIPYSGGETRTMIEQAGVIAIRDGAEGLRVLLIPSRQVKDRWVIPKGHVEPELSPARAAELEAYEEAGVRGEVATAPLGSYRYQKRGQEHEVQVFLMRVEESLDCWPERTQRFRRWCTLEDAAERVEEVELKALLLSVAAHAQRGSLHFEPQQAAEEPPR